MIISYRHIISHDHQIHLEMIYMLLNVMQSQILTLIDHVQVYICILRLIELTPWWFCDITINWIQWLCVAYSTSIIWTWNYEVAANYAYSGNAFRSPSNNASPPQIVIVNVVDLGVKSNFRYHDGINFFTPYNKSQREDASWKYLCVMYSRQVTRHRIRTSVKLTWVCSIAIT